MQRFVRPARGSSAGKLGRVTLVVTALVSGVAGAPPAMAAVTAPFIGEIQSITVDNPTDVWSGGRIVVGGEIVTIPRNLLIDLPANRLTLQQLFAQAPAGCVLAGETGLAKADLCNATGAGGIATIAANRTTGGNVIAGDVFIQKGIEFVGGQITFIDFTNGYFRVNGNPGDPNTGTMVRLNDPGSRHTIQQGPGCAAASAAADLVNCSPDPRFTLDPDNYTNVFSTGYPWCIPSTFARPFPGLPNVLGVSAAPAGTAQAAADGTGDLACPSTNRSINNGNPVDDSRRFAPVQVGDSITAEGNFEKVNGVRFLSAHSTTISRALTTKNDPAQPDYVFLSEVFIDGPAFQNQRARDLIIGFTTLSPSDVLFWTLHYDPATNTPHEFPWATVVGCDVAGGAGTCSNQGIVGAGASIFRIRHDVDFVLGAGGGAPARPKLSPCAHLRADPRFGGNICPGARADGTSTLVEEFAILSPIPHEIQARTGHALANPGLADASLDVSGRAATNGQYLFPFGIGLGGIDIPAFDEINLDGLNTPFSFSGIPWNLDRRLSPGGCDGPCEATPQPLDPFPWEGIDPRTQSSVPTGPFADPNFTASTLASAANRILSFVDGNVGNFNGNATVLALPGEPPASPILPTPELPLVCSLSTGVPSLGTTLNVTAAVFGTTSSTWRVQGSSTSIGATVTIHLGDALTGAVVGTAVVPADGIWTFLQSASAIPPDATQRISVEATLGGGSILSVPVTVRPL